MKPGLIARGVRGFTLVEVLVVIALLSMVMLGLAASMRSMAQTEVRVDDRLQAADDMRVATAFIESATRRVSSRRSEVLSQSGTSLALFAGEPNAVAWLGVMPARYGAGGRHFFRLAIEPVGAGQALVLRFAPWGGVASFPDWTRTDSRVLVANATRLDIAYGDDSTQPFEWVKQWAVPDRVPARMRVSIAAEGREWPFLVLPMRTLAADGNGRGGFSMGPE